MFVSRVLGAATGGYLEGFGGRKANNALKMQGMTLKSLKHHYALQPLFIIMGAGVTMVVSMCVRAATKQTDVNWTKQKEPDAPMEYYRARQYKLFNPGNTDQSTASPAPNYKN